MGHAQRLEDVVLDVVVEWLPGHALHDISGHRRGVVGICWGGAGWKDALRQVMFQVIVDWPKIFRIADEQFLDGFFEARCVGHAVAERNWSWVRGWNLEVEIIIHIAIQIQLALLYLLHYRCPGKKLRN